MTCFSERLKKLRIEKNLSQESLAERLGLSRSTISNYEQNIRVPSVDILNMFADYFDVSIDYLLGRSDIRINLKEYLSQNTPNVLIFIDAETGKIIEHSSSALTFYGYSKEELLNKTIFDLNTLPKYQIRRLIEKVRSKNKEHYVFHFDHKLASGEIKKVKVTTTSIHINDKCIISSSINDISGCQNYKHSLNNIISSLTNTLGDIIFYKMPYKKYHCKNVSNLSYEIGKHMALPLKKLNALKIAGLLHDIGELNVPSEILNKPSNLSQNEYTIVKEHPLFGKQIIQDIPFEHPIHNIIAQHHERLDGSGYPNGLKGNKILIEARILAVADVIEAITSNRPHRTANNIDFALNVIYEQKSIKYDEEVVDICTDLFMNNQFKFDN